MQIDRGEGRSRRPRKKRTPLADLTNAAATSSSSSSSLSSLLLKDSNLKSTLPPPSSIARDTPTRGPQGEHGGASVFLTSTLKNNEYQLDFGGGDITCDEPKHSVGYTRCVSKGTKAKRKAPCTTSSCLPVEWFRSIKGKLMDDANINRRKAFSVPCGKPKKKQQYMVPEAISKAMLPQDFIQKQKAYFAEVDAFELPEEVVSGSELE